MQPRIRILVGVALVSLILAVMPSSALADCSSPDGVEGEVVYNADYKVVQYCNGSHWALMGGSTLDARIGVLNAGKWCAANGAGDKIDCTADAPTTVVGSDKQVIFNDGGTALAGATQLFWDKANNRLGIGTTGPANPLDVVGSGTNFQIRFRSSGNEGGIGADPNGFFRVVGDAGGALGYGSASSNTFTEVLRINNSGDVGIGTASPAASSLLDITSTTKGFLSPRMTTAQRDAIASPATGLMIYNTTNAQFEFFNGTAWSGIGSMTTGQIAAFASATCPTGWTEYTPARGRFLRGIDNGAGNDPSGTRAPGNVQADELASHTHTITDNGVALKVYDQTGNAGGSYGTVARPDAGGSVSARRDMVVGNAGGAETRPKNVAVIFCQYSGGGNVAPASATVSGTANYVAKFTGATVVGNSQIFDNGTNVGVGTTTPASSLHVAGGVQMGDDAATCPGAGDIKLGTMRYSAGAFSVCAAGGWTPLMTGTGALAAGTTGQVQFNGGSGTFAATTGLRWDNTNKRLGVVPGAGSYAASFTGQVNSALSIGGGIADGEYARLTFGNDSNYGGIGLKVTSSGSYLLLGTSNNYASGITNEALVINPTGNIGIGTVAPAYKLDVSGTTRLQGAVGVNTMPASYVGLYAYKESGTAGQSTMALRGQTYKNPATSGTYYDIGTQASASSSIPAGVTDSGYLAGVSTSVLRSTDQSTDTGTLASLTGVSIQYGHYVRSGHTPIASRTTTNAFGVYISPYHQDGTITNSYGLFIGPPVSGGTVGSQYAVYQAGTAVPNYFAGNVGIGTATPSEKLEVNGKMKATAFGLDIARISSSTTAIGNKTVAATCASKYVLTGGGCLAPAWGGVLVQNYPSSTTAWSCSSTDSYGTATTLTAYALCVRTDL